MTRTYHPDGSLPLQLAWGVSEVFVFGSNLSGIHGAGAARAAHRFYGAAWGVAEGRTGSCYAIPTVAHGISGPLTVPVIAGHVAKFLAHAAEASMTHFFVTRIGCGLAGHADAEIAPLFKDAPPNCSLPEPWRAYCTPEEGAAS